MATNIPIITIDGPSGVGKGTLALELCRKLGWHILDSGALYRLSALAALQDKLDLEREDDVAHTARNLEVRFETIADEIRVMLRDEDVTARIRQEDIGMAASKIAKYQSLRDALLQMQRDYAGPPGLVADGRDMGTTVFPEAALKLFITASCEERAQRRYKQLKQKGINASLADLESDLRARDEQDANRKVSPLKPADDAIVIDTTELSIDDVNRQVLQLVQERFSLG